MKEKPWEEMSKKEIEELKKQQCTDCKFAKCFINASLSNPISLGYLYCDYLEMTGELRGCSPINCEKHIKKQKEGGGICGRRKLYR